MATQLAHRMHQPQAIPLGDLGFKYLPELGLENAWISEALFWCLFIPFIIWSFSPFVTTRKRFYTAVIYARILVVLSLCQLLRIISFTVTQLPSPNYHCREGESTAIREMPSSWIGHILVDISRQATHGCGDLIFSSHTTFVLVGMLTYTEYGEILLVKIIGWIGVGFMSLCIIASRKHYTVDVVVAWYTVPLIFFAMLRRWTTKRPPQDYWPHRAASDTDVWEEGLDADGDSGGAWFYKSGDAVYKGDTSATMPWLLPVVVPVVGNASAAGMDATAATAALRGSLPTSHSSTGTGTVASKSTISMSTNSNAIKNHHLHRVPASASPIKDPGSPPPPPPFHSLNGSIGHHQSMQSMHYHHSSDEDAVVVGASRAQRRQHGATSNNCSHASEVELRDLERGSMHTNGNGTPVGPGHMGTSMGYQDLVVTPRRVSGSSRDSPRNRALDTCAIM